LRQAAGEAIARANATGENPFALMMVATGETRKLCISYVEGHPLSQEKWRLKRERDAAVLGAEPGPVVWVRRQFSSRKHAAYRLADVEEWHWSSMSGGVRRRANRYYPHGYVWCDAIIAGRLGHTCMHGPPPHRIKVCVTKKGNEKFWREIEVVAPIQDKPEPWKPRRRKS
jgi:hypothetical protein